MKQSYLRAQHVEFVPRELEDGVLYISSRFRTASHLCCCGCRTKIVTPLRATEFELTELDGLISLYPSIGNWNQPCRSHYWIRDNRVIWAAAMSKAEIRQGRAYDDAVRDEYYGKVPQPWWRRAIGVAVKRIRKLLS